MIPTHLTDGRLPQGIHPATWTEVADTFGFSPRRQVLLQGLRTVLTHLRDAGCEQVWIGGSFVRTKPNPMDVDVVWDVANVDFNSLHPAFVDVALGRHWTKAMFGVECFPSVFIEAASSLPFVEFFQVTSGTRLPTGVIVVALNTL